MSNQDQGYRFLFEGLGVRGELVQLEASWQALLERHDYPQIVRRVLGEACAATVLLSSVIKFRGALVLQVQGDGQRSMSALVAQATDQRTFRGMARWHSVPESDNLAELFGKGRLVLTAESPKGERYQGIVGLEAEHMSGVLEGYFKQSEQLSTRFWLAANGKHAAGLMLQSLPSEATAQEDWQRLGFLAETVKDHELLTLPPEALLHRLFHEETVRLFEPEPLAFRCTCSREVIENALLQMGRDEVTAIVAEEGAVKADCEFCGRRYKFDAVDVEQMFSQERLVGASGSQAVH